MNRLVRHQLRYGGGYELRSKAGLTQVCMQAISKAHTILFESDGRVLSRRGGCYSGAGSEARDIEEVNTHAG